jgi:hypothetical protein
MLNAPPRKIYFFSIIAILLLLLNLKKLYGNDSFVGFSVYKYDLLNHIDPLDYDSHFETRDNESNNKIRFQKNDYSVFLGEGYNSDERTDPIWSQLYFELRVIAEHYHFYSKNVLEAKCLLGVAPGLSVGIGSLSFM